MRSFYNEIKGMKVKDLPSYVKPMLSIDYVKKAISKGLDNYHAKYIQTSSIEPLFHVCFGGMIFSYLVALPEERRHLEHQQHAKEHGGHWSTGLGNDHGSDLSLSINVRFLWLEPLIIKITVEEFFLFFFI